MNTNSTSSLSGDTHCWSSNGDNSLDILDYDIIADCYSDLAPARNCSDQAKKTSADLNDDGSVNGIDSNLLVRNVPVRSGG